MSILNKIMKKILLYISLIVGFLVLVGLFGYILKKGYTNERKYYKANYKAVPNYYKANPKNAPNYINANENPPPNYYKAPQKQKSQSKSEKTMQAIQSGFK